MNLTTHLATHHRWSGRGFVDELELDQPESAVSPAARQCRCAAPIGGIVESTSPPLANQHPCRRIGGWSCGRWCPRRRRECASQGQPADTHRLGIADVVGTASLVALPDHQGSGKAEIIQTARGPELVVDVDSLTPADGFYEVWLIDPKTFQMVGLGALNNNAGRFPIPDGLDLSKYRVVDVSIEPYDGNPLHSKNSVVRGEISA